MPKAQAGRGRPAQTKRRTGRGWPELGAACGTPWRYKGAPEVRRASLPKPTPTCSPHRCYGVSKMGVIALTRVLAREEPTLLVNSADPGYCATDQNADQVS